MCYIFDVFDENVFEICIDELLKRKILKRSCIFFKDLCSHFWCVVYKNNSFSLEFLLLLYTSLFDFLIDFLLFFAFLFTFCDVRCHVKTIWTCIEMFFDWIRVVWSFVNEHKKFTLLTFNNSTIFDLRIFRHVQLNIFHLRYRKIFVRSMIRQKDDNVFRCWKHDVKIAKNSLLNEYVDVEWLCF